VDALAAVGRRVLDATSVSGWVGFVRRKSNEVGTLLLKPEGTIHAGARHPGTDRTNNGKHNKQSNVVVQTKCRVAAAPRRHSSIVAATNARITTLFQATAPSNPDQFASACAMVSA
jgi:hypothetical protein